MLWPQWVGVVIASADVSVIAEPVDIDLPVQPVMTSLAHAMPLSDLQVFFERNTSFVSQQRATDVFIRLTKTLTDLQIDYQLLDASYQVLCNNDVIMTLTTQLRAAAFAKSCNAVVFDVFLYKSEPGVLIEFQRRKGCGTLS